MGKYLLIESQDSFDSNETHFSTLALNLVAEGNEVLVFLVQNGVLPARVGSHSKSMAGLVEANVKVLADEFSLKERGITAVLPGVAPAKLDIVIDQLAEGCKALWH